MFRKVGEQAIVSHVSENFVIIQITTERAEVERTCAALEAFSIPVMVEHVLLNESPFTLGLQEAASEYRILTAHSSEQQARSILGRYSLHSAAA